MANCEPMAIADTEYNRTSMFHPRVLFCTLIPTTVLVALLGGCIMPSRQDATPVPAPTEPPMAEPAPAPTPEGLTAVVNQKANVRTGPSTDYAVAFWLTAGAEGTVVGQRCAQCVELRGRERVGADVRTPVFVQVVHAVVDLSARRIHGAPLPHQPKGA